MNFRSKEERMLYNTLRDKLEYTIVSSTEKLERLYNVLLGVKGIKDVIYDSMDEYVEIDIHSNTYIIQLDELDQLVYWKEGCGVNGTYKGISVKEFVMQLYRWIRLE